MSKDYKVARKDVYAGRLEKDGYIIRGVLFTPDVDDRAIDLVYDTPLTYEVITTGDREISKRLAITNMIPLNLLLKELGYNDYLTQKDLNQIHKRLIASDKWMENYKIFIEFLHARGYISDSSRVNHLIKIESIIAQLAAITLIRNGKPTKEEPGHSLTFKRK